MTASSRKEAIWTDATDSPVGAYSPAVRVGDLLFISGQAPFDDSGELVGDAVEAQTMQVIRNLEAILAAAGGTLTDIVKIGVHLADFALFEEFDAAYRRFFVDDQPARTTVASGLGGILVEMDAIAVVGSDEARGR